MTAYYNEFDPFAAAWLRELIKEGHIAYGHVDERSIEDVRPSDLRGYTQCHFFAGIGVWSYALRNAGWPDDRAVWTGSCPCQPFSAAGKGAGFADERHLWPAFFHLIEQCRPDVVFGEQVASKDGLAWLDTVHADLEAAGYAAGAVDLCAAGVGAPHIRQRLWFVADLLDNTLRGRHQPAHGEVRTGRLTAELSGGVGELADTHDTRPQGWRGNPQRGAQCAVGQGGVAGGLGNASAERLYGQHPHIQRQEPRWHAEAVPEAAGASLARRGSHPNAVLDHDTLAGPVNGFWGAADWLLCRDGKWRPVEPGTFPLAHGAPARVGRLRGYGNAINAEAATQVIKAYLKTEAARGRHLCVMYDLTEDEGDIFG